MIAPPPSRLSVLLAAGLSVLCGFLGCSSTKSHAPVSAAAAVVPAREAPPQPAPVFPVMLGIDVLESEGFAPVRGKRIGLLTHAAGVNRRGERTIDVLRRAPSVKLAALFAPEHGLDSIEEAGKTLANSRDPRTGLPVHSLYGATRKPTPAMLNGLDALVIDLQDIGVRSYTFASAMLYTMAACFEQGVEVVVLDRPNPLGGLKIDGPPLDSQWKSYVGAFAVPYVHGLTIGELARMAKEAPGVMRVPNAIDVSEAARAKGRLAVVPMRGWKRSMRWPETGLAFVPTSPKIQDFAAVIGYAMVGLGCEFSGFSHGLPGTDQNHWFRVLAFKDRTADSLAKELTALALPGLQFRKISAVDMLNRPATDARGRPIEGVYVDVTDWNAWDPTGLSFQLMRLACRLDPPNPFAKLNAAQARTFNIHAGSSAWWDALRRDGAKVDVEGFLGGWRQRNQIYQQQSRRYWLYPE